jgi:hypothetical protein
MLIGVAGGAVTIVGAKGGYEWVFDLYTFGYGEFAFGTLEFQADPVSIEAEAYFGIVSGWQNYLDRPAIPTLSACT